jgi:hypothetical protein
MRASYFLFAVLSGSLLLSSCSNKKKGDAGGSKSDSLNTMYYEFHDFQSTMDGRLDSSKGSNDKLCGLVNDKIEYGFGFDKQIRQISSYKNVDEINVSFNCMQDKKYADDVFVLSIDDTVAKKNIYWFGAGINPAKFGEWSPVTICYKLKKEYLDPNYILKLYIWNKGKNTFCFDDLAFSFDQRKK